MTKDEKRLWLLANKQRGYPQQDAHVWAWYARCLLDRDAFNILNSGTQIHYVNVAKSADLPAVNRASHHS